MRILKLRFQNLNSLKGHWEIDFRHAAYANEGIFAITGSTGAGKSTILDAICLALYGATPRLGEITQSKNDLMSRHTGECLSEVIFSTKSGSYRCTWLQKRARKNPEGNLQSPTHEIAPYSDDNENLPPLETQTKKTKKLVAQFTGMDFDRFTRAMLLAQGSFAAFLQADANDRSNLLEEITGTEIYGEISKKVHEFKTQADSELKTLSDRLSGMTILTDEEEQTLTAHKGELQDIVNQVKTDIAKIEADKIWRQNLNAYTSQVNQLEREKLDLADQEQQFAPQKMQLQRALKALEMTGDIEKLNYQRDLLTTQLSDLKTYQQQLPTAEKNYQIAEKDLTDRQIQSQQADNNWQQAQPLFNQVRKLDTTLGQKNLHHQEISSQLSHLVKLIANNTQTIESHQLQLVKLENQRTQLIQAQQQIPNATTLSQTLVALNQVRENNQEFIIQSQSLSTEQQQLQIEHQLSEQQAQALQSQLIDFENLINEQRQIVDDQSAQLQQLTQGQSLTVLRQQFEFCLQSDHQVVGMQNDVQTWQTNLQTIQQYQQHLTEVQDKLNHIVVQTQHIEQQHKSAQHAVDLINRNLILLAKIQDLTQERDKLRQGEPCPLCGSIDHPFATHQPYSANDTEQELSVAKQHLNDITHLQQQLLLEQNSLQSTQRQLTENVQQLHTHNKSIFTQLQLASKQLNSQPIHSALQSIPMSSSQSFDSFASNQALNSLSNILNSEKFNNRQKLTTLQDSLSQIETLQNQQQQIQQQLSHNNEQYNALLHEQTVLQNLQQNRLTRISEVDAQQLIIADKQHHLMQKADTLLTDFNTAERSFSINPRKNLKEQLSQHIDTLEQLSQHYHDLDAELINTNDALSSLQQALTRLTAEQQNLMQNQTQVSERQHILAQEIANIQSQRQSLFGDRDVELASQDLIQSKNQALENFQNSQKNFHEISSQKEILLKQIASLTTSTTQLQTAQLTLQSAIEQRFAKLGFENEADYQASVLVDTEREHLQQLANQLHDNQQRNFNLLNEAKRAQQHLIDNPRTELTIEQLVSQLHQLQQSLSEQQKQLGAVEQQLISNEELKRNQQQLLDTINEQRRHTEEWKVLHSLIGSNDGKKFRNFAQGLTFNIMIAHANEQLKKMSDRYLLLADNEQPLMLNVMDNYQGGQIRTSKNLSGGESFIISLSLALGLSNMASHRMQVDSLFLDEGFGTLDEEALDVALDTLTNLQQSGKLIGVISHIQALKDRISSQIQIVPQSGGVSKIIGAGITRLD